MKKYLLILIFVSFNADAATPIWLTSKIKWIYPLSDGTIVVTFINPSPSCSNTATSPYHRLKVGENSVTQEGAKRIYSLLLSAAIQKKTVNINFDSSNANCFINRAYVAYN